MAEENEERIPCQVKNLAELKRLIQPGVEFKDTYHAVIPELVGKTQVVTKVQTNCFYAVIRDQPESRLSTCNDGLGLRSDFEKANLYIFTENSVKVLDRMSAEPKVLYEMEVYEPQMSMGEQNNTMRMEMM